MGMVRKVQKIDLFSEVSLIKHSAPKTLSSFHRSIVCFLLTEAGKPVPENSFEVVPIKKKKLPVLTAEELALGQTLVTSRKRKRDIMDMAWNRYMFNDVDQVHICYD